MVWLIPVICAVIAGGCSVVGAIAFVRAWRSLQDHAERLAAATPLALLDPAQLETALARIGRDFEALKAATDRAVSSVQEIRAGIGTLRLREATIALRLAGVAIRALRTFS